MIRVNYNKKIPDGYLQRYFKSPTAFRFELRNTLTEGWAFDVKDAFPEDVKRRQTYQKYFADDAHPFQRFIVARVNDHITRDFLNNLLSSEYWTHTSGLDSNEIVIAESHINHIDNYYATICFPLWIPASLEDMIINVRIHASEFYDIHAEDFDIHSKYANEVFAYSISNEDQILEVGTGMTELEAVYDLYESIWRKNWEESRPSITNLKSVIDIKKVEERKIALVKNNSEFARINEAYLVSKDPIFTNLTCYSGQYFTVEGFYDIFTVPLWTEKKCDSVEALLSHIKEEYNIEV